MKTERTSPIALLRRKIRSGFFRIGRALERNPHRYLRKVSGVIHVGANVGQERELYDRYGLDVVWIEPNPEVFEKLRDNLAAFPRQRALQYLVSDRDGAEHEFHVANNEGASSSMLDLKLHKEVWPEVAYVKTLALRGITLATLVDRERIDLRRYAALVLDAQGAELMVLKGAGRLLEHFDWIQLEVPDFEAYEGCCQLEDVRAFLLPLGYREILLRRFGRRPGGGCYYDYVYQRKASGTRPMKT